jgi:hypothetical protein
MYEFYSAAYKATTPRTDFLKITRLVRFDILDFRVARLVAEGDKAQVTVAYKTKVPQIPDGFEAEITDPWVRDPDGLWYKEKEELLLPYPTQPPPNPPSPPGS